MRRIVVGVDGSDHARRALEFAIDEAEAHGGRLEAVMVIPEFNMTWGGVPEAMYLPPETDEVRKKEAQTELDRVVDNVVRRRASRPEVERYVALGAPGRTLLSIANGADLLVVGSRGLGGFRGLLLGSVSQQCATHAPCPIAVVPGERNR